MYSGLNRTQALVVVRFVTQVDALFEAVGKLLGVFKDPVNVILLLVVVAEGVIIWKGLTFYLGWVKSQTEADLKMSSSLDGLTKLVERIANAKP